MKKGPLFTLLSIIFILVLALVATLYVTNRAERERKNEAARTLFSSDEVSPYVDMEGNVVSLEAYLGNILIVNSWASWSPFAATELPQIDALATKYAAEGVVALAVNRKEGSEQAQRYLGTMAPLQSVKVVIDTTDFFYTAIGGYAMPETVIYNREGTIIEHYRGTFNADELERKVSELVGTEN